MNNKRIAQLARAYKKAGDPRPSPIYRIGDRAGVRFVGHGTGLMVLELNEWGLWEPLPWYGGKTIKQQLKAIEYLNN